MAHISCRDVEGRRVLIALDCVSRPHGRGVAAVGDHDYTTSIFVESGDLGALLTVRDSFLVESL
ncbi:hypothetical protein GOOTI_117_00070 [Gordonia otitidis NBRC 100426]|uniref:Uncharacterized protein n=1 Tax=Gordonia otitidis (strain DSM 44809 / CCUG 52243 / JCM 12355 / NBRC 100426 / IFM 10032) TaxID=1108044 RepID=H5TMF5_GORO1|nr:hypothetical protein GOOTI_117_00070 [Gordonia otitidis NBRC 100426]